MAKTYKEHYNLDTILKTFDSNGNIPCFYVICSAERGPGKTYSVSKLLYDKLYNPEDLEKKYPEVYKEWDENSKFIILCRNKGSLGNCAEGILNAYLKDVPNLKISETISTDKVYSNVYFTFTEGDEQIKEHVGYVIPLKSASGIKNISSMFYDAWAFFMDEFQPLDNGEYLKDEIGKLYHIYKSVARGGKDHKAVRYMPVFLCSNTITIGNPYFTAFGLNRLIQRNTRFCRGKRVVFENCEVEGLKEMHESSPIDEALADYKEKKMSNMWLNDNDSLVCKPNGWGRATYICTLLYEGESIGVLQYQNGYTYLSRKVDSGCNNVYALTLDDNTLNLPLLRTRTYLDLLREKFFRGNVRVQDGNLQIMLMEVFG